MRSSLRTAAVNAYGTLKGITQKHREQGFSQWTINSRGNDEVSLKNERQEEVGNKILVSSLPA